MAILQSAAHAITDLELLLQFQGLSRVRFSLRFVSFTWAQSAASCLCLSKSCDAKQTPSAHTTSHTDGRGAATLTKGVVQGLEVCQPHLQVGGDLQDVEYGATEPLASRLASHALLADVIAERNDLAL